MPANGSSKVSSVMISATRIKDRIDISKTRLSVLNGIYFGMSEDACSGSSSSACWRISFLRSTQRLTKSSTILSLRSM